MSFTTVNSEDGYIVDIPYDRLLEKHNLFYVLKNAIIKKITEIPNYYELKLHPELTALVCNIIENSIKNNGKKHNINKLQLANEILGHIFNLNDNERTQITTQINYLYTNGKIKGSPIRLFLKGVGELLKRKFL